MISRKIFIILVVLACLLKFGLWGYVTTQVPDKIFEADSTSYLGPGLVLVNEGAFAFYGNYETSGDPQERRWMSFRTPGYPLFLGVLHGRLGLPLAAIIFIQILLTLAAAYVTYRTAILIDPRLGYLSAIIVLFDPAVTVFSLMLMTESLFLFLIAIFMWLFVIYLKTKKVSALVWASLLLVMATYVRPVSYYLPIIATGFILYALIREKPKAALTHAMIFLIIVYSSIGLWIWRNYHNSGRAAFTNITDATIGTWGVGGTHTRSKTPQWENMPTVPYYSLVVLKSSLELMTRPASFKYFECNWLRRTGQVFSYPWGIFCLVGLLAGIARMKTNIYFQFFALVIVYFIAVSVVNALLQVTPRFRVPMVPFLAILSSYGWGCVVAALEKK
ncbi:MAG: glycosyltransferase family 39 protein [Candidatus Omnitrophota bacterium]|nr:glycosyltransferase family 39 protein [Candidatus Omnitrophota bacterium]